MNSFELFFEVLFVLLLRSLLFSRTFYLRFASSFIALSRGDLFILSLLCPFVNPFFRFLLFLHFISLFLSLFVHFALLLCSFDIKSDNCASLSCHFGLFIIFRRKKLTEQKLCESLEAPPRFELGNKGFADLCLTTWLWRRIQITKDAYFCVFCLVVNGAEDEIRTRDVHLGKVTLYH